MNPQEREAQLLTQAEEVLDRALALGADDAEITLGAGQEFSCAYRGESLDKLEEAGNQGLGVRLFVDGRVVTGSSSDLRPEVVDALMRDLIDAAPHVDPDEHHTLAPADELDGKAVDLGTFDPATVTEEAPVRLQRALEAERAVRGFDARITATDGASFGAAYSTSVTAASNGLRRAITGGWQSLVADAICDDHEGKKRNGYYGSTSRRLADLKPADQVGAEAARRALARLGAAKPATGRYPVVFSREASPALIGLLTSCATATALWRQRTYLADRLNTAIASSVVTLIDDPLIPGLLGSSAVDGEGRARRRNVLVEGGELSMFLAAQYGANRTGLPPTASASRPMASQPGEGTTNLYMAPGPLTPEALIADIDEGIYVEGTIGFGFNSLTGDFSRGAFGRMIRAGQLAEPIAEFTVSASFDELFGGIDAVADDLVWDRKTACPTLRVTSMAVGGAG
ncbi:MAG: TldD/PmbA family protein [Myxococcota bacterium]|nr:TldD/PmbA family protein [Myxococcota bacterium]